MAPLVHHDLCFGCGQANLFGLHVELEERGEGRVGGRFFVKQDHQGQRGRAHAGVIAAALEEAMVLAARAPTERLEVDLVAPAPVGEFVHLEAARDDGWASASARTPDGALLARARARVSAAAS